MDNAEFLKFIESAKVIKAGSEAHKAMHALQVRALRL